MHEVDYRYYAINLIRITNSGPLGRGLLSPHMGVVSFERRTS
jgi:hypothetical protein